MSAEKLPPERRPPTSAADAASRLATIVDAAERAAASVIDGAEAEAQRYLEEAHDRADRIVAERLRELADQLDPPGSSESPAAHLKPVEVATEERSDDDEPRLEEPTAAGTKQTPRRSGSAGARLLATQMAISGSSRKEIEARLRNGFDIDDTSEILDAILGPEG